MRLLAIQLITMALLPLVIEAQDYDLLIKNGHVIDPKNNIDGVFDLAVKDGLVVSVAKNIRGEAEVVVDADGKYVTPGILDIHTHNYHGNLGTYLANGFSSVQPDGFTFKAGVTSENYVITGDSQVIWLIHIRLMRPYPH